MPAPSIPPHAEIREAADNLGVSEFEVAELAPELEPHLVQDLTGGPVFLAADVIEVAARHALSPDEQDLLDTLHAASLHAPLSTETPAHRAAASDVRDVLDDGTVHIQPSDSLDLKAALSRLGKRALVVFGSVPRLDTQTSPSPFLWARITARGKRYSCNRLVSNEAPKPGW
jgi:hypothetical protein